MIEFIKQLREALKSEPKPRMSEEELMVRMKVFIGICLALTLVGIVFVVLYSLIFVTQPLGAISPIDTKFFELIIPIATFLTGTLSGIMLASNKEQKPPMISSPPKLVNPQPQPKPVAKKEEILDGDEIG
jgi:hypothetical protein